MLLLSLAVCFLNKVVAFNKDGYFKLEECERRIGWISISRKSGSWHSDEIMGRQEKIVIYLHQVLFHLIQNKSEHKKWLENRLPRFLSF